MPAIVVKTPAASIQLSARYCVKVDQYVIVQLHTLQVCGSLPMIELHYAVLSHPRRETSTHDRQDNRLMPCGTSLQNAQCRESNPPRSAQTRHDIKQSSEPEQRIQIGRAHV